MIKARGTTEAGGLRGKFTMVLDIRSGRSVTRRDYGVYVETEGFDGSLDWTQDLSGGSHFLNSAPALEISVTQAWLRRRGWCDPQNKQAEVLALADEKDGSVVEAVWRVTPRGGIPLILRFDRATGLPRQSELRLWGNRDEVDTGGHLILTPDTASKVQLQAVGQLTDTGGGTQVLHSGLVSTREIRIGAASIRNQVAKVLPLSPAGNDRGPRPARAGFLGLELFERFVVQLNREARTLTLTPIEDFPAQARGTPLPIRFTEDAPVTAGTFDGVAGDFEIDSGDAGPAIVEGYWAEQHGLTERLAHGLAWSGTGVGGDYQETVIRGDFTRGCRVKWRVIQACRSAAPSRHGCRQA